MRSARCLLVCTLFCAAPAFMVNAPAFALSGTGGVCCLGSSCTLLGRSACEAQQGYFVEGTAFCVPALCMTGACCTGSAACTDNDGLKGPMTESLCTTINGAFLGAARCADDPCVRFRIPPGFEIVEISSSPVYWHAPPSINSCGEITFTIRLGSVANQEVYLFDNGVLARLTDDSDFDTLPSLNDEGMVYWVKSSGDAPTDRIMRFDGETVSEFVSYSESEPALDPLSPTVNNLAHVAWDVTDLAQCPPPTNIAYFDGEYVRRLSSDGRRNQSAAINDADELVWTDYDVPCEFTQNWTSQIQRFLGEEISALPSQRTQPQGVDIDATGRVAWGDFDLVEVWENGATSTLGDGHLPSLNNVGDVAFQIFPHENPLDRWEIRLLHNGQIYPVTGPDDPYDNHRVDMNDAGELVWARDANDDIVPSAIRMMRRIRTGDYDLDMDVDQADFGEFRSCFTGSVPTGHLCQCRFYDIDHDRDVDADDFALFLSNYTDTIEDCNGNAVSDFDDILNGTAPDCNANGVPDGCDVGAQATNVGGADGGNPPRSPLGKGGGFDPPRSPLRKGGGEERSAQRTLQGGDIAQGGASAGGASADVDGNGVPDECQCRTFQAVHVNPNYSLYNLKNRYISFTPRAAYWKPGTALIEPHMKGVRGAIRVTLTSVDGFPSFNGQTRWVGPPQEYPDATHVAGKMLAAPLQCAPHYRYWGDVDLLHVYGDAIVPNSTYYVQIVSEDCQGTLLDESKFSPPAMIPTMPKFGDVIDSHNPGLVNFADIAALVSTFQSKKGSPIKPWAQMQPNVPSPGASVNFLDIGTCVSAFQGRPYVTLFAGPSACP